MMKNKLIFFLFSVAIVLSIAAINAKLTFPIRMIIQPDTKDIYSVMSIYSLTDGANCRYYDKDQDWILSSVNVQHHVSGPVHMELSQENDLTYNVMYVYNNRGENEKWIYNYKNNETYYLDLTGTIPTKIRAGVRFILSPETEERYAVMYIYSTQTGKNEKWIQKGTVWEKSKAVIPTKVRHDLRMVFQPETEFSWPVMYVYSALTSENEKWIMKENTWIKSSTTIPTAMNSEIRFVLSPETKSDFAIMYIYNVFTGANEKWLYKNNLWVRSQKSIRTTLSGNIRMALAPKNDLDYAVMYIYNVETGENEKWFDDFDKHGGWYKSSLEIPVQN